MPPVDSGRMAQKLIMNKTCRQLLSSKLGLGPGLGVKLRTRLDIREEGCTSLYSGPYRGSLCPESTASVEGSWRKLKGHWAAALAYAGERSDPHSAVWEVVEWFKVVSGKTEDKESRIKLEVK